VRRAGLALVDEGGGYLALQGAPCEAKVVVLNEVAKAERQPLLGIFSRDTLHIERVEKWLGEHRDAYVEKMGNKLHHTHPELVEAFLRGIPVEQRLKGLAPEQRLKGLAPAQVLRAYAPEQRLEGLDKDEVVLALPDEILAALSPELLASLRPSVRRRVAARLRNGHGSKRRKRPAASKAARSRTAKPRRQRKTRSK
jgi:hypothetical protein